MANAGAPVVIGDVARWYCKATAGATQSIPNAAFTALGFSNADSVDNLGIHDPVSLNQRFKIGLALGWWLMIGTFAAPAGAGSRRVRWLLNGVTGQDSGYVANPSFTGQSGFWSLQSSCLVQATDPNDYVELYGWQDSGAAASTVVSGDLRSGVTAIYQGP